MKHLTGHSNLYNVGITGKFKSNYPYHRNILGNILRKLIQIQNYCKTHNRGVIVYLDENTPFSFYELLLAQGLTIKPVLQNEHHVEKANHVESKDINEFLENTCDYIMIVCNSEEKDEFDFEKPSKFFIEEVLPEIKTRLTPNPAVTLREAIQKSKQPSDPYSTFFHENLYTVVPFNYYDQIMQTKPDSNALTNREFSNAEITE